jgi:hypothetical protein
MRAISYFSFRAILVFLVAYSQAGCGYRLRQGGDNILLEHEGVRRVFIQPFSNTSFHPGIENLVYNQVQKALMMSRSIELVGRVELADATLMGTVHSADYGLRSETTAPNVFPKNTGPTSLVVATLYTANLHCSFVLVTKKNKTIWSGAYFDNMVFPANNQLGMFGKTSHLINQSEFERALQDLSERISMNMSENMFSLF